MRQNPSLRIEELQPFKITGVLTHFTNALKDGFDGMEKIPAVWKKLTERENEIQNISPGFAYGVMLGEENGLTTYVAGFSTSEDFVAPEGMVDVSIPYGLWAIFTHYGSLEKLQDSNRYAYEEWLPSSEYQMRLNPHIEFYSPKSEVIESEMEMEFWIPIEAKS
jgi:AraC family transcriptional regulator